MKRQAIPPPTIGACQKQPRIHLYSLGNTTKKIEINKNTSITISIHTYRQPSVFICWHVLGMWEEARVSAEKATSERYEGSSWEPKPRLARKGTMLPIQQKKKKTDQISTIPACFQNMSYCLLQTAPKQRRGV